MAMFHVLQFSLFRKLACSRTFRLTAEFINVKLTIVVKDFEIILFGNFV